MGLIAFRQSPALQLPSQHLNSWGPSLCRVMLSLQSTVLQPHLPPSCPLLHFTLWLIGAVPYLPLGKWQGGLPKFPSDSFCACHPWYPGRANVHSSHYPHAAADFAHKIEARPLRLVFTRLHIGSLSLRPAHLRSILSDYIIRPLYYQSFPIRSRPFATRLLGFTGIRTYT